MTDTPDEITKRRRLPFLVAGGVALLIIAVVAVVLILAGGDKTQDGTGRDKQPGVTATTNTTGGPPAGSDR